MDGYLIYGVEFAITDRGFILLEDDNHRRVSEENHKPIPMDRISTMEVRVVNKSSSVSSLAVVLALLAALFFYLGWFVAAALTAAGAAYFFKRGPSKHQIYSAYIWTDGQADDDASFNVSSTELPKLRAVMANFPSVKFLAGNEST